MTSRFLKPALHGFEPYQPGEQPPDGERWTKLNTNESALPPSPRVLDAIRSAVGESLRLYPSPTAAPARAAIAEAFGLDAAQVCIGNGGDELIAMCFRAFAGAGGRVAFAPPTYPLLEPLCGIHEVGASPHPLEPDWALPESFFADPAPLKFVVNPNSPTGTWVPSAGLERLVGESKGVVVVDEAYADFAPETRLDLLRDHDNVLLLRTMSKAYALAGMRIGFALGSPELIAALDTVKDSYPVDRLAIAAAVAAIGDAGHHRRLVESVIAERDWLSGQLAGIGFAVERSATNFVFCRPPEGLDAARLVERLRERRILVRRYHRPPIDGWIRITVGRREQHELLLEAVGEVLAEEVA
jgi:histidinol-phosphate aminotransferase